MLSKPMNLHSTLDGTIPILQAARTPDVYGLEIELEGKNISNIPPAVGTYWKPHQDNSLRKLVPGSECIEYVFRNPYKIDTTEKAVLALFTHLTRTEGVEVFDSYRTSIHVHVNFAMETFRTIYNFMVLSLIFDELFVSQHGEHRIGNNFCLRAKDAMGQVIALITSIEAGQNFFAINPNERYSSINFASLIKFGSVEFRSLECTTDVGRVMKWVRTLDQLKQVSKTFNNPTEIVQAFSRVGAHDFCVASLGPFAWPYLYVRGFEDMLFNGMRIAQDLAYCSEWNAADPSSTIVAPRPSRILQNQAQPQPEPIDWDHGVEPE